MQRVLPLDKNGMELIQLDSPGFQLRSEYNRLSEYADEQVTGHWHGAFEFSVIEEGSMYMKVDDEEFLLRQGEGVFVNSNALHMAWGAGEDCVYRTVIASPALFGQEGAGLRGKYVDILLGSRGLSYCILRPGAPGPERLMRLVCEMDEIYRRQREDGYELAIWSRLLEAWRLLFLEVQERLDDVGVPDKRLSVLKDILRYIQQNYTQKMTLEDIAAAVGVSKSSCSHIFKSGMREPVFEYLMRYRIEQSLPLLVSEDCNVTETALAVGFSGGSYYSEVFRRFMGCTPQEYRKRVRNQEKPPLCRPHAAAV